LKHHPGLLAAVGLLTLLTGACGGGGGSSPTAPPPPQSGITFTSAGSASGISLAMAGGSQGTTLALAVDSSGIQNLYGVGFHLTYPYTVLHFTGATEGAILNAGGGVGTSFQVVESPPGTLIVGLSRLGVVGGTSAAGPLMTLQFSAVASGTGTLAFAHDEAADSNSNPIAGVSWNGGTVQATLVAGSAAASHR
jgi:hypothetical protein